MGLSIHYSGEFNRGESLSSMIEEVKNVAEVYNWDYFIFDEVFVEDALGKEDYSDEIYGIHFTPPGCETVSLAFLSNGKMSSAINLKLFGSNPKEQKYLYMLSVKTQYAGIEIHKLVIHLFKYLSKKYFANFKLSDEGQYWETGNEQILKDTFVRYTNLMDSFQSSLEIFPKEQGESFEDYFSRLLKRLQKRTEG